MRWMLRLVSHGFMLALGFALGVYTLPILIASKAPPDGDYQALATGEHFKAGFRRDLKGSDFLHWGEGEVMVTPTHIGHKGTLAPGPDYKLYLAPDYVEDAAAFAAIKEKSVRIGNVTGFSGFLLPVPAGVDVAQYTTVVVWCETFGAFISAAKYR